MRIALVSLDQAWENKEINRLACRCYVEMAKTANADLIIFPEMTLTAYSMNTTSTAEDEDSSKSVNFFRTMAAELHMAIVFGVVFRNGEKATNNMLLVDSMGRIKATYAKIHPFTFAKEDQFFEGGNAISSGKVGDMTFGLSICYDLRFPEIFSALAKTSDVIINIANWPNKRIDHWNTLLKARAIENLIFMIGVNRTGADPNSNEYPKSSQAISPNGELLLPMESTDQLDVIDIDGEFLRKFRQTFPTTKDRKISLYKSVL
jgi:omega-amidase